MVIAVDRGFAMVVAPRDDDRVTVTAAADGQRIEFAWDPEVDASRGPLVQLSDDGRSANRQEFCRPVARR